MVAGTNTALQFQVTFGCLADNSNDIVRDQLVLDAIVYTPLPYSNDTPQVSMRACLLAPASATRACTPLRHDLAL